MPPDYKPVVKIGLDILLLLVVGFPVLIFHLHGKPTLRGFNCDDDSIRYPYKDSTITNIALYVVGVFLPVIVICVTEFTNEARSKRNSRGHVYVLLGRPIPHVIWCAYKRIGIFLFGACMSQLTTDIAKYSVGRLRPHFLEVCQPNVNCTLRNPHEYITDFQCMGNNQHAIRESRLSFPSGHSSFSAYTMVFTVIYLQACMGCRVNRLLKPFIQFILLMMTWYTALSRIADYKHHWSDVMIGFLQGALVAVITLGNHLNLSYFMVYMISMMIIYEVQLFLFLPCVMSAKNEEGSLFTFFVSDFFTKPKEKDQDIRLQNIAIDTPVANYNTMGNIPETR